MGRRGKPAKGKVNAKRPLARKVPKNDDARVRDLEKRLAESLEREKAAGEILRVISGSPTDLQPVLDAVAESATRLCASHDASIFRLDSDVLRLVAHHGPLVSPPGLVVSVTRGSVTGRAVLDRQPVQAADLQVEVEEFSESSTIAQQLGHRTILGVPLLREGKAIGAISLRRTEVQPFTDKQIALLQTFADQAVIAIENARLFTELEASNRELTTALEQQTATAEILRVISSSPIDLQPVFDTIVRNATRLCAAAFGGFHRVDGDQITLDAQCGLSDDQMAVVQRDVFPLPISRENATGRAVVDRRVIHIRDIREDAEYGVKLLQTMQGFRTILAVPMLREALPIGALALWRREVKPFTDTEIGLVQTFADQAVIAIENVRLFNETKEALEQQTATAEILRVISSSPTDVQPVFDTIAASATRLCDALFSLVFRFGGETITLVAHDGMTPEQLAATRSVYPMAPGGPSLAAHAIQERRVIAIADSQTSAEYPQIAERARAIGYRSAVSVPMLRSGAAIGAINVSRVEAIPFTDTQIELLQTFADQAVIAIENVRLFTELQTSNRELTTALDTQTATSEILAVISRSQTDVQPVFDAIVASAIRLLRAHQGVLTRITGDRLEHAASTFTAGAEDPAVRAAFPRPLQSSPLHGQAVRDRAAVNITDVEEPGVSEALRTIARARGYRSVAAVPLLRHDEAIGTIAVTRREPGGFADDEIALLQTFADQAVIAIENARLLTELQEKNASLTQAHAQVTEALEQQTATSEILKVIASSPTDTQPVFGTIAASARRLLRGHSVSVSRVVGDELHLMAFSTTNAAADAVLQAGYPMRLDQVPLFARVNRERTTVIVADVDIDPDVTERMREVGRVRGFRSFVWTPMVRDDVVTGIIAVTRREPGAFSVSDVALLQTFADQAVIAIENVRLFTELQTSNRELTTALDTQTATSTILRVISGSRTDVQPVFDAIVESAVRLLGCHSGAVTRVVGNEIVLSARVSPAGAGDSAARSSFPRRLDSDDDGHAQVVRSCAPINVVDALTSDRIPESSRAIARASGYRSMALVPLLRHEEAIGTISVSRREPGGFTDDEIALLQTFADQAVIAIENARLLSELQTRTAELTRSVGELTALGEVGRALSSTLDLETVLQTIVMRANELAGTAGCAIWEYDAAREEFRLRASDYVHEEDAAALGTEAPVTTIRRGQGVTSQVIEQRQPVQIDDIAIEGAEENPIRQRLVAAGHHALLAVPLLREDEVLGVLVVTRKTAGEFQPEIVQLLSTFATQSALAIQNARLFREIEIKSREVEVASQHKSEFLASMSHELRTPLNAIIGFSDVLLQGMFGEMTDKQTEYLSDILASGQHLLSLINDILDLSKIEAGRMELDLADFHLPSAIDDALLLMRERAGRRGVTLERHVDERLGEIRADQRKVKQVLLNLLSNAVKFTQEGGRVDVRAALVDGTVEISVTDTGVGIAPEDHDAVFEEFRQVGKADKKAEGTGLGLALCRKFVELHDGRIWLKSQVGQGSTFTFTMPLRPEGGDGGGTTTLIS